MDESVITRHSNHACVLVSAVAWVIRHLDLTDNLEAILLDLILAIYRRDWRDWKSILPAGRNFE